MWLVGWGESLYPHRLQICDEQVHCPQYGIPVCALELDTYAGPGCIKRPNLHIWVLISLLHGLFETHIHRLWAFATTYKNNSTDANDQEHIVERNIWMGGNVDQQWQMITEPDYPYRAKSQDRRCQEYIVSPRICASADARSILVASSR